MIEGANGQFELLADRVVIHRQGPGAKVYHTFKGPKAIPLSAVLSVRTQQPGPLTMGYIQVVSSAADGRKLDGRKVVFDASRDENTVVFRYRDRNAFREAHAAIEAAVAKTRTGAAQSSTAAGLANLAELKASGLLTDDEFQSLKQRLIVGNAQPAQPEPSLPDAAAQPRVVERSPIEPDPAESVVPPGVGPHDNMRWRILYWFFVTPVLLIFALMGLRLVTVILLFLLAVTIAGFLKPIPSLGIRKPASIAIIVWCLLFSPLIFGMISYETNMSGLRASDPAAYLAELQDGNTEKYLRELKVLDPAGFDALIAKHEEKHMTALKSIDPERYKFETDQIAAAEAEKRAIEQAKSEAERLKKEIAEKQRLEKLRASDPKAYLEAIKGTPNWISEFQALDPKGYAAYQAELVKAKVPDYSYDPYTKDQYPKTFAKWGSAAVKKINALRKQAAFLVAMNSSCNQVDISELSDQRSEPGKKIVIFVDCVNHQRFYLSEEDIKSGAKPVSKNQKTAMISDESAMQACEAQVKAALQFPSSFDRSLLNSSIFRSEYGNIAVEFDFEAMNGLGNVLPQFARCVIDDQGIHPAEISNR